MDKPIGRQNLRGNCGWGGLPLEAFARADPPLAVKQAEASWGLPPTHPDFPWQLKIWQRWRARGVYPPPPDKEGGRRAWSKIPGDPGLIHISLAYPQTRRY